MDSAERLMAPVRPSERDVRLARKSSSQISRLKEHEGAVTMTLAAGGAEEAVTIPAIAFRMLAVILNEMAHGHAVALSPLDREISTQKAADLLNVSRPHFIKLLESGRMPFRKVGSHRRVRFADVLEYRARMDAEADRAFAELVDQAQELGLGYE